jgi:predicted dehydrogenase
MGDFGVAVVGTGFIGPIHVEALQRAGRRVVGILGSSPAKSRQAADALGIEKAYENYEQLLADDAVGSVHLATPNILHFDHASRALAAGKHVMCEKPLAMTSSESAKLVELAEQAHASNLAAGVNYNIRYFALNREAAQRAQEDQLGKVFHLAGSYVQDWLFHDTDFNWRVMAEDGGEMRAVSDIGTHWLDLMLFITGLEVEAVCADLKTVHPVRQRPKGSVETFSGKGSPPVATEPVDITTDDYGCIMLRFVGGAKGCMWVSQVTAGRKNNLRYEIAGSNQTLAWDMERPNELWIGHRDAPNELLFKDPALVGDMAAASISYPGGHKEGFADSFKQLYRDFYRYIDAGDFSAPPSFPTFADGHREIVLCDAILESHRKQAWVNVPR